VRAAPALCRPHDEKETTVILGKFVKQPAEREAYAIEYEDDLADGDTLADAAPVITITRSGPGTTDADPLRLDATDRADSRVTMWLSAGTGGSTYKVSVTVTTFSGRVLQDEFIIKIKDY
jgi:hypothetical protein